MPTTVIYDACVLYPASLRSFLMWVGHHELVHARWSEQILDECFENILENRPDLDPQKLSRTRNLICQAVPDCLVKGFEPRIEPLDLPDDDDRHVLGAAIEAGPTPSSLSTSLTSPTNDSSRTSCGRYTPTNSSVNLST